MALPSRVRTALTVAGIVVAAAGLHAVSPTASDPDASTRSGTPGCALYALQYDAAPPSGGAP